MSSTMHRAWRFAPLLLIVAALGLFYWSGGAGRFGLAELKAHEASLRAWALAQPVVSVAAFILAYGVLTGLCLPIALVLTLAGGAIFGPWVGGAATIAGVTLGAAITFLAARSAAGAPLRRWAERRGGTAQSVLEGLDRDAFSYMLLLRLLPLAPFGLINVLAGMAAAPFGAYLAATVLGAIPTSFIYAGMGSSLSRLMAQGGSPSAALLADPHFLWPLAGLASLSLISALVQRRRRARKRLQRDLPLP